MWYRLRHCFGSFLTISGILSIILITAGLLVVIRRPTSPLLPPVGQLDNAVSQPSVFVVPESTAVQWDAATISAHQSSIASAIQCAQRQQNPNAPAIILDNGLALEAATVWHTLSLSPTLDPAQILQSYDWAGVISVDFEQPAPSGCGWSSFNPAGDSTLRSINRVGIAVFPPQMGSGTDLASAVVIGRK